MAFTDTIATIDYKQLILWQDLDSLAENDEFVRLALLGYRRPNLQWIDSSTIDIENNTGIQHQTKIIFPDMEIRSVTEITSSADKYRRFIITETASFGSSPENSGLRSGLSLTNDTWYAIYAVKSTVDATKFVLVGDTTLPTQSNYSTLNTRYGTSSWLYLGMIRYGDSDSVNDQIIEFVQSNTYTRFVNTHSNGAGGSAIGIHLAQTASGVLNYSPTNGTGDLQIPDNLSQIEYSVFAAETKALEVSDSSITWFYVSQGITGTSGNSYQYIWLAPASDGFNIDDGSSTFGGSAYLVGFYDGALSLGMNPVI